MKERRGGWGGGVKRGSEGRDEGARKGQKCSQAKKQ